MSFKSKVVGGLTGLVLAAGLSFGQDVKAQDVDRREIAEKIINTRAEALIINRGVKQAISNLPDITKIEELIESYGSIDELNFQINPDSLDYSKILDLEYTKPFNTEEYTQNVLEMYAHATFLSKIGEEDFVKKTFEENTNLKFPETWKNYIREDISRLNNMVVKNSLPNNELIQKYPVQEKNIGLDEAVNLIKEYAPHTTSRLIDKVDIIQGNNMGSNDGMYDVFNSKLILSNNLNEFTLLYTILHELGHSYDLKTKQGLLDKANNALDLKEKMDLELSELNSKLDYAINVMLQIGGVEEIADIYADRAKTNLENINNYLESFNMIPEQNIDDVVEAELVADIYALTAIHEINKNNPELATNILADLYRIKNIYGLLPQSHHSARQVSKKIDFNKETVLALNDLVVGKESKYTQNLLGEAKNYFASDNKKFTLMNYMDNFYLKMLNRAKDLEQESLNDKDLEEIKSTYQTLFKEYVNAHKEE